MQFHAVAVLVYHQPLKLEDFLIVKVDFGSGRYIECLSIDATDNAEVINVPERTFHQYAIAESKEAFGTIPS